MSTKLEDMLREDNDILEDLVIAMACQLGIRLNYECNLPGIMGWWWEVWDDRSKCSDGYFPEIYDAILDYWKTMGISWETEMKGWLHLHSLKDADTNIVEDIYTRKSSEQKAEK